MTWTLHKREHVQQSIQLSSTMSLQYCSAVPSHWALAHASTCTKIEACSPRAVPLEQQVAGPQIPNLLEPHCRTQVHTQYHTGHKYSKLYRHRDGWTLSLLATALQHRLSKHAWVLLPQHYKSTNTIKMKCHEQLS